MRAGSQLALVKQWRLNNNNCKDISYTGRNSLVEGNIKKKTKTIDRKL